MPRVRQARRRTPSGPSHTPAPRAARSHVAPAVAAELESLHFKQQREGLSVAERETMDGLTRQYERALVVLSQAAAILRARGHDVNGLLVQP